MWWKLVGARQSSKATNTMEVFWSLFCSEICCLLRCGLFGGLQVIHFLGCVSHGFREKDLAETTTFWNRFCELSETKTINASKVWKKRNYPMQHIIIILFWHIIIIWKRSLPKKINISFDYCVTLKSDHQNQSLGSAFNTSLLEPLVGPMVFLGFIAKSPS